MLLCCLLQASELADDMRTRRRRSFAAVVGRTRLTAEQEQQLLSASFASRILDLLLALDSHEERVAMLPDCFTPPAETCSQPEGETETWEEGATPSRHGFSQSDATHVSECATESSAGSASSNSSRRAEHSSVTTANSSSAGGMDEATGSSNSQSAESSSIPEAEDDDDDEDIWCTPLQLLNEIDSRLKAVTSSSKGTLDVQPGTPQQQLLTGGQAHNMSGGQYINELQRLRDEVKRQWLDSLQTEH